MSAKLEPQENGRNGEQRLVGRLQLLVAGRNAAPLSRLVPRSRSQRAQCAANVASGCWAACARSAAAWSEPMVARRPDRDVGATVTASLAPAGDRPGADAEEAGGLGLAESGVDGTQQPLEEVDLILVRSASLAPALLKCNPLY